MTREVSFAELLAQFPELNKKQAGGLSLTQILSDILHEDKIYKIGRKITHISAQGDETGQGTVMVAGVILDPKTPMQFGTGTPWSRSQLADSFINAKTSEGLAVLAKGLEYLANGVQFVLLGELAAVRQSLGGMLISKGLLEVAERLAEHAVLRVIKAVMEAFTAEFAKEVAKQYFPAPVPGSAQQPGKVDLMAALVQASGSGLTTLLDKTLGDKIDEYLSDLYKVDPRLGTYVQKKCEEFFVKHFVKFLTVDKYSLLIDTAKKAIATGDDKKSTFESRFQRELKKKLEDLPATEAKKIAKAFLEPLQKSAAMPAQELE